VRVCLRVRLRLCCCRASHIKRRYLFYDKVVNFEQAASNRSVHTSKYHTISCITFAVYCRQHEVRVGNTLLYLLEREREKALYYDKVVNFKQAASNRSAHTSKYYTVSCIAFAVYCLPHTARNHIMLQYVSTCPESLVQHNVVNLTTGSLQRVSQLTCTMSPLYHLPFATRSVRREPFRICSTCPRVPCLRHTTRMQHVVHEIR
jgi:hypothetical protein